MAQGGELDFAAELEIQSLLDQLQKEKEAFIKSRLANFPKFAIASRKEFQNNKNVKSDVKKSSAFVKKIRSINTEGIQQCIRDTETLNLTQYISEIVASIVATTFKAADCGHMVKLCICLHLKYDDFTEPLVAGLKQALFAPSAATGNEEDGANSENNKRKRIQIRFLIELYQAGLCNEEDVMYQLLRNLLGKPTKLGGGPAHAKGVIDLQGISTFVKYGSEILCGYPPKKAIDIFSRYGKPVPPDLPVKVLTNPKIMRDFQDLLQDTYGILSDDLVKAFEDYMQKEKKFEKDRLIHGSLSEAKQNEYEYAKKLYEKLLAIVTSLAECMSMKVPELKFEEEEEITSGLTVWEGSGNSGNIAGMGIIPEDDAGVAAGGYYGDPETRSFYEDLPDLLTLVPLSILGITPEQADEMREEWAKKEQAKLMNKANSTTATGTNADDSAASTNADTENALSGGLDDGVDGAGGDEGGMLDENSLLLDDGDNEVSLSTTDKSDSTAANSTGQGEEGNSNAAAGVTSVGMKLNSLIAEKLVECFTKAKADEFCVSFCYLSPIGVLPAAASTAQATPANPVITVAQSKQHRKKLAAALLKIPKGRQELIPFYARIAASLGRLYPDLIPIIIDQLKKEFYGYQKFKKTSFLEYKLKNIKYIAECMKFFLSPPIVVFRIFLSLLQDLSAHNIELLSVGLESCGRFLYLVPYTRDYMENQILERMLRIQRHKNLSLYQQHLLQGAYFNVKPTVQASGGNKNVKAKKSVLEEYVQYLLVVRLSSQDISIDTVIKSLRRLPWNAPPPTENKAEESNTDGKSTPPERDTIEGYVIKYALKLSRVKYVAIANLSDCLSGLSKYYPNVVVRLVDNIIEEIQRALEMPFKRDIQRIVGVTKLLGELYNYTAIPSTIIFDLLYALISPPSAVAQQFAEPSSNKLPCHLLAFQAINSFGNTFSPNVIDPKTVASTGSASDIGSDAPNDLFRAQLICELLLTCGQYYVHGHNKDKLSRFLLYFQRYLCSKQMIPLHLEYLLLDTFDYLEEQAREYLLDQVKKTAMKDAQALADKKKKAGGRGGILPILPDVSKIVVPISFPRYDTYETVQAIILQAEQQETSKRGGNLSSAVSTTAPAAPAMFATSTTNAPSMEEQKGEFSTKTSASSKSAKKKDEETIPANKKKSSKKTTSKRGDEEEEENEGEEEEWEGESEHENEEEDSDENSDDDDDDSDDDDDDSEDDDDEDDSDEDDSDEDEDEEEEQENAAEAEAEELAAAKLLEKMRIAEEDDEFEKAFKSMMQDSIASANTSSSMASNKQNVDRMAIPAVLPKPKNLASTASSAPMIMTSGQSNNNSANGEDNAAKKPSSMMQFKLLSRDTKGRIEARALLVPQETTMAQKLLKAEEELRLEKQRIKERVLQINSMQAEAEMEDEGVTGSMGNASVVTGSNLTGAALTTSTGSAHYHYRDREVYSNTTASGTTGGGGATATSGKYGGGGGSSRSGRYGSHGVRAEETRKGADTLNLDEFLAEANAAEIRRISTTRTSNKY